MHLFLCHRLNQAVSIIISMFVLLNQLGWDDGSLQMAGISFPALVSKVTSVCRVHVFAIFEDMQKE